MVALSPVFSESGVEPVPQYASYTQALQEGTKEIRTRHPAANYATKVSAHVLFWRMALLQHVSSVSFSPLLGVVFFLFSLYLGIIQHASRIPG